MKIKFILFISITVFLLSFTLSLNHTFIDDMILYYENCLTELENEIENFVDLEKINIFDNNEVMKARNDIIKFQEKLDNCMDIQQKMVNKIQILKIKNLEEYFLQLEYLLKKRPIIMEKIQKMQELKKNFS